MSEALRVAFVSLGCVKNLVDSEKMLGQLAETGCALTSDESDADVVVINTCGFLEAARAEADEVVREILEHKQTGRVGRVVVVGCLVQRDRRAILDRLPGIDAIVGVNNRDDVVRAVLGPGRRGADSAGRPGPSADVYLSEYHPFVQLDTARLRLTPRHYAYLRISEGCDQKCTFCTIPSIRGRMHCKPPEIVLAEARELISDGVTELHLIGQDTTSYGLGDDRFEFGLTGLLRALNKLDGIRWIRLMYAYPSVFTDDLIDAIAEYAHVCKYVDLPLQHISDRMLKAMHRRITRAETERLLERLRTRIPDLTVRTTLIAGFPGETAEDFAELLAFVRDFRFDALGVFPYSHEPETPAGRMKNRLPDQVIRQRVDELMKAQQEVAFALADEKIGQKFEVLVDRRPRDDLVAARHQGQAPMVDGVTHVRTAHAMPGQYLKVRCVARDGYDLVAEPESVVLPVVPQ
jgi:ribosomal protein S12 methylthiotransferase